MKKLFFPKDVNVSNTGFIAGQVNDVEETPGSIQRWILRGCTVFEDVEEALEELAKEVAEEVAEEVVELPVKEEKSKRRNKNKK